MLGRLAVFGNFDGLGGLLPNSAPTDMWLRFPSDQLLQRSRPPAMPPVRLPVRPAVEAARAETEHS